MQMKKFTLLELLIVVAIIGILITLLLPSLEKARKEAESTVCKTNLNSQFTAISRYAVDNSGWLPNYQDYDSSGKSINGTKWVAKLWRYVYYNNYGSNVKKTPQNVFDCPSLCPDDSKNTYGWNIKLDDRVENTYEHLAEFKRPAEGVLIADSKTDKLNKGSIYFWRHRLKANCVFLDGHVEGRRFGTVSLAAGHKDVFWRGKGN